MDRKHDSSSSSLPDSDSKRQKMSNQEENPFQPVGAAVQRVDGTVTTEGITNTGAEDAQGHPVQEIESMCMNCEKNGTTKLLMTSIPYFREIIIMSFLCPHCGFKNSEVQPAGKIQEKGSKYVLKVDDKGDLNRQIIKSDSATCRFAEIDVEIPPKKGQLTTVEGLLSQIHSDLSSDQPVRKHVDPAAYEKIEEFLNKLTEVIEGRALPLTVTVDDPAGNSWVEYVPGEPAHKWSHIEYFRTQAQNAALGVQSAPAAQRNPSAKETVAEAAEVTMQSSATADENDIENLHTEVQTFNATCPSCHQPCPTHMKPVVIPHFKEVIIMSTNCEHCGYKSNEVKTGGAIPSQGRRVTLKVEEPDDLARDILKSETCALRIPELNLDLHPGTLGGRFTTLEGILTQVKEELESRVFAEQHDSMDEATKNNWLNFLANLEQAYTGQMQFTVIMEDPMAASYIQNVFAPDPDPNMEIEDYDRTAEENEDLGLNQMDA